HSLALKSDGTVWAWGLNVVSQLGDGTEKKRLIPVQVKNLIDVVAIAAGGYHSLALKSDGTVWGWGRNDVGQLGSRSTLYLRMEEERFTPVQVQDLTGVVAVSSGDCDSLAIKSDGTAWVWGNNKYGQLGKWKGWRSFTPIQVKDLSGVETVSAVKEHSFVPKSDGTVWAWGKNDYGQLGDGTPENLNALEQLEAGPPAAPAVFNRPTLPPQV
ncbi:MAG: RCC1 repeat- and reductase domain-containing protein, partial [Alicyclobacillaceae bacterium]|nr:RCC1 repeat- and reductase domain-containing protein [Alicyclobacillaceae bacterium]